MERNDISEMFLAGSVKTGAFLGLRRKKGIGGEIEKAGPALAKGAGNLGNTQAMKRKGAAIKFIKSEWKNQLHERVLSRHRRDWELGESRRSGKSSNPGLPAVDACAGWFRLPALAEQGDS